MKRLKIAVLFGGCSPEYSVSLQSAAAVLQNMDSSKYEAVMVGIPCALSCNHGKVLINGYEAPIIGRICMDQMIVDITDLPDVICPLSSRQVKYLKVSDKNTYISFWSVGIFMHTISLYIF